MNEFIVTYKYKEFDRKMKGIIKANNKEEVKEKFSTIPIFKDVELLDIVEKEF